MNILFQEAIQFADNTTLLNTGVGGAAQGVSPLAVLAMQNCFLDGSPDETHLSCS